MFLQKTKVNVRSRDDQVVGIVTLAIRVVAGVTPLIRRTVVRTMGIVDLKLDTLIVEVTGSKVSVIAMKVGVMPRGRRVMPPGDCLMRLDSRVTPPSNLLTLLGGHVMPLGSRVASPGNSGAAGALAGTTAPRDVWLRAPVVAPPAGV